MTDQDDHQELRDLCEAIIRDIDAGTLHSKDSSLPATILVANREDSVFIFNHIKGSPFEMVGILQYVSGNLFDRARNKAQKLGVAELLSSLGITSGEKESV